MSTPFDRKILLVIWLTRLVQGDSIVDAAAFIRQKMPNVAGVMLKTSNGVSWQGHLSSDSGPKIVTGVKRIQEWVEAFEQQGLEVHIWGVPQANRPPTANQSPNIFKEADKYIKAANIAGVKSVSLDIEHGPFYWQGSPAEVQTLMNHIRSGVTSGTHIGMILDGRHNRDFTFWVDPWIPFIDSLQPMVYPNLFGKHQTIEQHMDEAFSNLEAYNLPIVPMLQSCCGDASRPTPDEIMQQGDAAWARGAAGISFFRLGTDQCRTDLQPQMGDPEYTAVANISKP